jgi:hypothetical protein
MKQIVRLTPEQIDRCFSREIPLDNPEPRLHQQDVIVRLFKLLYPEWDRIVKLDDYPHCNENTWKYILRRFQELDRERHPDAMPGGAWMNWGFSSSGSDLPDFAVERCGFTLAEPAVAEVA